MRRMITDKELSFFDSIKERGAQYVYNGITYAGANDSDIKISDGNFNSYTNYDAAFAGLSFKHRETGASISIKSIEFPNFNPTPRTCNFAFLGLNVNKIIFNGGTLGDGYCAFNATTANTIEVRENLKLYGLWYYAFMNSNLVEIGAFDVSNVTNFAGTFVGTNKLAKLHFKHIRTNLDISVSTAFDTAALVEIISNLDDTGSAHTLTIGATNLAKLSEAQIKVATDKGWNLA